MSLLKENEAGQVAMAQHSNLSIQELESGKKSEFNTSIGYRDLVWEKETRKKETTY